MGKNRQIFILKNGNQKNPGWRPNFIPCAVFSKRPKQEEGSFQNFPKEQNRGFFDFQIFQKTRTKGSLICKKFPKDCNNRRFSRLVISQNFQKTGNHRRVFDLPKSFGSGGSLIFQIFWIRGFSFTFTFFFPKKKDGTGGYEKNQITALTLIKFGLLTGTPRDVRRRTRDVPVLCATTEIRTASKGRKNFVLQSRECM